jgi:hypothetical protein
MSPKDVGMVRRTSWATALIVVVTLILLMTATNLLAQASGARTGAACAGVVSGTLVTSASLRAVATAVELQGVARAGAWHTMEQANVMRIAADPSSHLHAFASYLLARTAASAFSHCQSASVRRRRARCGRSRWA